MAKQNFESKHPVSLLGELSAKRKFGAPLYELVMQEGPSHQRQFLYSVCWWRSMRKLSTICIDFFIMYFLCVHFQVSINGQIYQPNVTSLNKKEAKASAAKFALQKMGFISEPSLQAPPQPQPVPAPQQPFTGQSNATHFAGQFAPPNGYWN